MDVVIGVFAAWGLVMLFWALIGVVFLPVSQRGDSSVTVVLSGKKSAGYLLFQLRGVLWLREFGLIWWNVIVLTDHLPEDVLENLLLFTNKHHQIMLMTRDDYIEWMED